MTLSLAKFVKRFRRDIALRTGLVVACSTLISLLLLTSIVWFFLVNRLESRIENSLVKRHEVAESNGLALSEEERVIIQAFRRTLPVRDEGVFAWLDATGNNYASNVTGVECRKEYYDGWLDISQSAVNGPLELVPAELVDTDQHDRFRFLANQRGENCLVFGRSMYEVDALQDSVKDLFIWLIPLCLLPSIIISLLYSASIRNRLVALGTVVKRVAGGELDVRVPVTGDDDLDRLARTTNHSFDRLQESVNTLQQLSSVIAHDLRGPLSRVSNPLDEAIRANESGQVALESLYEVQEGLVDARSVFDALLRITQIESGRRRLQFKETDLFTISEELYEVYLPVVEDSGRTFEFEVKGEGTSIIDGDSELLRQAIVNLVENAIRYTPENAHIRLGVLRHETAPILFVKDNGPGVPEAERERVLQRLYRYQESTRGQQGHGLGLSLVKAIAELHHAALVLEDAEPGLKVCLKFGL